MRPIDIQRENKAKSVGDKHEEISMRWVEALSKGEATCELWDSLQKEYDDFEEQVYPKSRFVNNKHEARALRMLEQERERKKEIYKSVAEGIGAIIMIILFFYLIL